MRSVPLRKKRSVYSGMRRLCSIRGAARRPTVAAAGRQPVRGLCSFRMRLLVVEDERTLARHLRQGLQEAGWTVDLSERVDDAWRLILLNPYDVVILDLGLPGED